jgi:salicylate hydroxylase
MVWLGPHLHVVQYPVRGGECLNLVAFMHGSAGESQAHASPDALADWDHKTNAADLRAAMEHCCAPLRDLLQAVSAWRLWLVSDRPPLRRGEQMARGLVALLGDAAHPMRPYLAQGAGMAIEDAQALGRALQQVEAARLPVATALKRYALERWERNARVQARALRNGEIFHSAGVVRMGRDMAMRLLGERLLDIPWLYGGPDL